MVFFNGQLSHQEVDFDTTPHLSQDHNAQIRQHC